MQLYFFIVCSAVKMEKGSSEREGGNGHAHAHALTLERKKKIEYRSCYIRKENMGFVTHTILLTQGLGPGISNGLGGGGRHVGR